MASTALAKPGSRTPTKHGAKAAITKAKTAVSGAAKRIREGVQSGGQKLATKARSLVARERAKPDSIGNIIAGEQHGLEAAAVLGLVDNSSVGEAVRGATGFLRASDVALGGALIARGMGFDEGHETVREIGTSVIKAQTYDLVRGIGGRLPSAMGNFLARHGSGKAPQMPKTAGAEEVAGTDGADEVAGDGTES